MKITDFSKKVSLQEGKKKNVDIAQISEIIKIANELLGGQLYTAIRKMTEDSSPVRVVNPKTKKTIGKVATKSKKS